MGNLQYFITFIQWCWFIDIPFCINDRPTNWENKQSVYSENICQSQCSCPNSISKWYKPISQYASTSPEQHFQADILISSPLGIHLTYCDNRRWSTDKSETTGMSHMSAQSAVTSLLLNTGMWRKRRERLCHWRLTVEWKASLCLHPCHVVTPPLQWPEGSGIRPVTPHHRPGHDSRAHM